jgi:hypothetical protein
MHPKRGRNSPYDTNNQEHDHKHGLLLTGSPSIEIDILPPNRVLHILGALC